MTVNIIEQPFEVIIDGDDVTVVSVGTQGPQGPTGPAGTTDHAALTHLDFAVAGHTGQLGIANGGTGQSTATAAINALLPSQSGQSGKALTTNGTAAAWSTVTTSPAGSSGELQYNNAGAFGGTTGITYASSVLTFAGGLPVGLYNNFGLGITVNGSPKCLINGTGILTNAFILDYANQDVSLVRSSAGVLKVSDSILVGNGALICGQPNASTVGLTVKAAASATANLTEWQNSSGTALGFISGDCTKIVFGSTAASNPGGWSQLLQLNGNPYAAISLRAESTGSQYDLGNGVTAFGIYAAHLSKYIFFNSVTNLNVGFGGQLSPQAVVHVTADAANHMPLIAQGAPSQTANLTEWQDSSANILSTISENGYYTTRKTSAPADAELSTGELALWFDSTAGAAKLMIKAKNASGTVVTGSVSLA